MLFVELFNQILKDLMSPFISVDFLHRLCLKSVVVLVFLFPSVILLDNSSCSSLMVNHHIIISLTPTLLQCCTLTLCSMETHEHGAVWGLQCELLHTSYPFHSGMTDGYESH